MESKLFRSIDNRVFAGVCGGLGNYCDVDPLWFRLGFAISAIFSLGITVLVYLAIWLLTPNQKTPLPTDHPKQLFRSRYNSKIAGVCGGLAEYFNIDPIIMRITFFCGFFVSGLTLIMYILLWCLAPVAPDHVSDGS